jgi:hypothetical protein
MRYPLSRHLVTASSIAFLAACAQKPPEPTASQRDTAPSDAGEITVSGVVQKAGVGVGCWQFVAADSTHYELRVGQAPETLLVDQKRATLRLKHRPDLMSNCMVGQIVDVQG